MLRFSQSVGGLSPDRAAREFASFRTRFARNRDSLPQTDEDRAFHLVAEAAQIVDRQLPFVPEKDVQDLVVRAHRLLDEALSLDPTSADALRMQAASSHGPFDEYYGFLSAHLDEVRTRCEERLTALDHAQDTERPVPAERRDLERMLVMSPYLRWRATLSSRALICGRNREALAHALALLELDPTDQADVRFTAALACAKLEDAQQLERITSRERAIRRTGGLDDAWTLLSRCGLAYKERRLGRARRVLARLASAYPHAAVELMLQREFPEGVFARFAAAPHSQEELATAISEATVLLREGRDRSGRGSFGRWVFETAYHFATPDERAQATAEALDANALGDEGDVGTGTPSGGGTDAPSGGAGTGTPSGSTGTGTPGTPDAGGGAPGDDGDTGTGAPNGGTS